MSKKELNPFWDYKEESIILNKDILARCTNHGALTNKQKELLETDGKKGWMARLKGKEISKEDATLLFELKGVLSKPKSKLRKPLKPTNNNSKQGEFPQVQLSRVRSPKDILAAIERKKDIATISPSKRLILLDLRSGLIKELSTSEESIARNSLAPFYILEIV